MSIAGIKQWIKTQPLLRPTLPVLRLLYRSARYLVHARKRLFQYSLLGYRLTCFLWYSQWLKYIGRRNIRVPSIGDQPRRIVMLVSSDLRRDPRVQREARALAAQGFLITVLCPAWSPNPSDLEVSWGSGIEFRILPALAGRFVIYFPYLFGRMILKAALREEAWAYHAHDLDMSLTALLAAAKKKVACVCDFHEWYSENVSFNRLTQTYRPHWFYRRWLYRAMERLAIHSATEVITVCDSIGESLAKVYQAPKPVHIIRNIPEFKGTQPTVATDLRKLLNIAPDQKIVLYQGGLGPSRNLEPVIQALVLVRHAVLVIRGPGFEYYAKDYKRLAKRLNVRHKLFCLPPVPSMNVVAEARSADMGLWTLLANVGLNFKYSLPNKVFEYLAAGVPILAADLPEVRKIVLGYQVGSCFDPQSPESIAACINHLVENPDILASFRHNMAHAVQDLGAEREWNKLVNLYRSLKAA